MKKPFLSWKLSKLTGKAGAIVHVVPGVFSLKAELGLEADRKVDVGTCAKTGFSAGNMGDDRHRHARIARARFDQSGRSNSISNWESDRARRLA